MNGKRISDLSPDSPTAAALARLMWDSMYIHAQKVIVPCPHCSSRNAVTNPTCVQCGAPLGSIAGSEDVRSNG